MKKIRPVNSGNILRPSIIPFGETHPCSFKYFARIVVACVIYSRRGGGGGQAGRANESVYNYII